MAPLPAALRALPPGMAFRRLLLWLTPLEMTLACSGSSGTAKGSGTRSSERPRTSRWTVSRATS
eukprot:2540402-Pyramimonas_sp.AAC.1